MQIARLCPIMVPNDSPKKIEPSITKSTSELLVPKIHTYPPMTAPIIQTSPTHPVSDR